MNAAFNLKIEARKLWLSTLTRLVVSTPPPPLCAPLSVSSEHPISYYTLVLRGEQVAALPPRLKAATTKMWYNIQELATNPQYTFNEFGLLTFILRGREEGVS